ncbi:MAG: hypothetical protein CME26_10725 [Gemmatimonadetes bacterium]|nr:hypothetical protein [Gemmatimonadota bacterium]
MTEESFQTGFLSETISFYQDRESIWIPGQASTVVGPGSLHRSRSLAFRKRYESPHYKEGRILTV